MAKRETRVAKRKRNKKKNAVNKALGRQTQAVADAFEAASMPLPPQKNAKQLKKARDNKNHSKNIKKALKNAVGNIIDDFLLRARGEPSAAGFLEVLIKTEPSVVDEAAAAADTT